MSLPVFESRIVQPERSHYTDFWSILLEDEVLVIYIEEEKSVIDFQFLEVVFRPLF